MTKGSALENCKWDSCGGVTKLRLHPAYVIYSYLDPEMPRLNRDRSSEGYRPRITHETRALFLIDPPRARRLIIMGQLVDYFWTFLGHS